MSRARRLWIAAAGLAVAALLALLAGVLVLRSAWFSEKVRARMVAEVEKASGGRCRIGAFRFDWRQLRAEVDGFTLRGGEPPDGPPLARADAIVAGIRIVSLLRRAVDIQYLDVRRPRLFVILYADGHTNLPPPRVRAAKGAAETILDLAIGRFSLQDGSFEVQGRGATPFSAQGRDLRAQFTYDASGPRYGGRIDVSPADFHWGAFRPAPVDVSLALAVEKNRVRISSGRVATARSEAEFSGAIDNFVDPSGAFQYRVRASLAEAMRAMGRSTPLEGSVTLAGRAAFHGTAEYQASGTLHAAGLLFRPDRRFTLRDGSADAAFGIGPHRIALAGLRFSGTAMASLAAPDRAPERIPVAGRIETAVLRDRLLEAGGVRIQALGGWFTGKAALSGFDQVQVEGEVAGFDARQALRVYNGQTTPWDATVSGAVRLSVSPGRADTLRLAAHLAIAPSGSGAPVNGSIDAAYDGAAGTLDLGRSFVALPSTRADFSGVLGRKLQVHLDSRDFNDLLPALDGASLPVSLRNGEAVFDGAVTGKLDDPRIQGRAHATHVTWQGHSVDALAGEIDLGASGIIVRGGSVEQGALRLEGSGSLALREWKVQDGCAIAASGTLRDAPAAELLALAGIANLPLTGTVGAEGKIAGTVGDPRIEGRITAARGTLDGEPFDRFTGAVAYTGVTVELTGAQATAGVKRIALRAAYRHQPGNFASGQLRFQLDSNAMPLGQFKVVREAYPGIGGTAELHAGGVLEIGPGAPRVRLVELNGALHGRGLRLNEAAVRDVDLTAVTKDAELTAGFQSEVAGSRIQGEGHWRLAGDYPGSVRIGFQGLDLERMRAWLRGPRPPGGLQLTGSAEGTLTIAGPALDLEQWKAKLELPVLRIGPGGGLAASGASLALHNAAPVSLTMERGIIRVDSARLVGRATDLSLAGTIDPRQKSPLDLRLNGRFDLATLRDLTHDMDASGTMETSVTIRGPLAQPRVTGRLELKNATFALIDIPVGVSKTNAVILFDESRATIESFSGQSGGGTIALSGFAGYSGETLVFRLHATAHEVRVRYPEDFSTVADASLNLTGASDSSTLTGRVTILRTGFNPHSDFSSVLANSGGPVRTPSVQTGLVANMHFDVQIDSAPDITFESSLAQGLQAEGSLRLRGTGSNPSLLGRINITQGQIVFFGTTFSVDQGSISFYNPVKIEPVLDMDLDTKARGIDVTLNISGPIDKLNMTPRSDPPMPFSDIVALLATGRSPATDYASLMAGPASPQSLQQMGASALLGQAIASPVTGRLQRFFGVTRLKIDTSLSSLTGAENNPQARLTIEQQVTPEITFTYITDVSSTNPLVIQVEWAFSRHWSALALRDENGLVGLNFVYRRGF